jgi:hypothetical protein
MFFSRFSKVLLASAALFAITAQPASAQYAGDVQQQIINGIVQNIIQNVRDQVMRRRLVTPPALRFSGEEGEFNNRDPFAAKGMSNPFGALAYAKSPVIAPAPASMWLYGANLVGNADRASTIDTDIHTWTVTGAFDVTKIGIFTGTDALTFIGTGSHTWSRQYGLPPEFESSIPSTSGTLSYLNGGFSADFTALATWTRNSLTTPAPLFIAPPDSSSLSYTGNAQYRFDLPYTVWFEPTAGVTYTELYTQNFGTKIADTTEVHGGGRVGFETKWMGFTIQPTLSGQVYKIVDSNFSGLVGPGVPFVAPIVSNLGGRGSGKITVIWTPQFSSYLEVHGSGTAPTEKPHFVVFGHPPGVQTYGAQAGLRYTW